MSAVFRINPEIIFFQEIVPAIEAKLKQDARVDPHPAFPYYTMTAVSKNIKIVKTDVIGFGNSEMGRNMLCVEGQWWGLKIKLINSHLESMWDHSKKRKAQFVQAMEKLRLFSADPNTLAIFGGDLNLRDPEVSNVPPGVQDAWVAAGSDKATKYTWDCKLNDNKNLRANMRCRFDRLFYRAPYQKLDFYLTGTEKRKDIGRFPSDHFAIVCKFAQPLKRFIVK
ncbi:Endonuclease/exonuclease/phosphatase family protein [Aphelenchoides fujianensis]|nr:Endonuclease/exonuclease/phosphatase family protein [Aphelenchoides fujianensis]